MFSRLSLLAVCALTLAAADPFAGVWKLNAAKSKYDPGPAPRSSTLTFSADGAWVVVKTDTVDAAGKSSSTTNRFQRDGKEYPYQGPLGDKIAVKMIDARTSESVVTAKGKPTVTTRSTVAADGKSMTRRITGLDPTGVKVNHALVYEK